MKLVSDPSIARKIAKMQERVRWQHPLFDRLGIDPTRLVLDDEIAPVGGASPAENGEFSFCVLGDSGNGMYRGDSPQRRVAERLLATSNSARFILHTGDVVYLVGSSEQYPENFIRPYRELLLGGDRPNAIAYDEMVFRLPFLPVLGNHDYYDLPLASGLVYQLLRPLRSTFRYFDLDLGWHGSYSGDAYARAFIDYLKDIPEDRLLAHLESHYHAITSGTAKPNDSAGRGLHYQPGIFTRLPNRYYRFRYGGIDFFALDSNTFNAPRPIAPNDPYRQELAATLDRLQTERDEHMQTLAAVGEDEPESLHELLGKIEQLEELVRDFDKQLNADSSTEQIDTEQLAWLERGLIESWADSSARGRIIYFHHPPYVTEATKWHQGQTLAVRHYLRGVFDRVATEIDKLNGDRPLVDLVLNGHAHCFEYLETLDTGHADRGIKWVICGGSGFSLRRQRSEGNILQESIDGQLRDVAISHQFIGKTGRGKQKYHPYSFLQVDVAGGERLNLTLKPQIAEYHQRQWKYYQSKI